MSTKTFTGWNGVKVAIGDYVKVRAPGFGAGVYAEITAINDMGFADITILRATAKNRFGWKKWERATAGVWWLEKIR